MSTRVLTLAIVLAGLAIPSTWADEPATAPAAKVAVPDVAALKQAQKLVNDVYADDIAKAKNAQEKADLGKKLLQAGIDTKSDVVGKYILLGMAKDMAAGAGDADTTFSAVDELTQSYQVDVVKTKTEAMGKLSKATDVDHAALVDRANTWIDDALAVDYYDTARQFADLALPLARATKDLDAIKDAGERVREVSSAATAYQEVRQALVTLVTNPKDPEANLAAGRFYCLTKGLWEKGLPMLAMGKDEGLKAMAKKELADPTEAQAQVELANGWWTLAQKYPSAPQESIREHAGQWYEQALPNLTGLEKAKIEKRVAEIGGSSEQKPIDLDLGNKIKMKLVLIPSGKFVMGSPDSERDHQVNESPQHEVIISKPFYMGIYPVTQEEYTQVVGKNPSQARDPKNPVDNVSWDDAVAFCKKLSQMSRKPVRLPTEAEWEYACRAGTSTRFSFGDDEKDLGDYAWWAGNSDKIDHPVGQKKSNPWGLYEMNGNVHEWCGDWYNEDYYAKAKKTDPQGPSSGTERVMRSGSYGDWPVGCRPANRFRAGPGFRGFRYDNSLRVVFAAESVQRPARKIKPAQRGDWVDLMKLIDSEKDAVSGKWVMKNGELYSDDGGGSKIQIPYQPPLEYDYVVEFTKTMGNEAIVLLLSRKGVQFIWLMGGYGNTLGGFGMISGRDIAENPTRTKLPLQSGRKYRCLVQVRAKGVKAFLDDKLIVEYETDFKDIGPHGAWSMNSAKLIGLGTWGSPTVFHSIKLHEVSGKAKAGKDGEEKKGEMSLDLGNEVKMKLVQISAGKFTMGSPETEKDRGKDEVQHEVTISKPFYMGVTHVTVDQFAAFVKDSGYKTDAEKDGWSFGFEIKDGTIAAKKMDGCSWRNPSFDQKGDHPVVQVSWNDAKAFCDWLSKKSGKTVQLPTESQWEYACRAGTKTAYPWGDDPDKGKGWANCADQSLKKKIPNETIITYFFRWDDGFVLTSPVGSFKANAFGLYDMIGNAWEWCSDRYGDYDKGAGTGAGFVLRGGCWDGNPQGCRSARRGVGTPGRRCFDFGFRVSVDSK